MSTLESTKIYVKSVLLATEPDAEVIDIRNTAGSSEGDNIAGELVAVQVITKIRGVKKTFHFMCKNVSSIPSIRGFLIMSRAFFRESEMYKTALPSLTAYQREIGIHEPITISVPHHYDSVIDVDGESDRILLQDMRSAGFKMADKRIGLNFEECKTALAEIAKLHALSYAIRIRKKKSLSELFPYICNNKMTDTPEAKEQFAAMMHANYTEAINYMEEIGEIDLAQKLQIYSGKEIDVLNPIMQAPDTDPLKVLVHGDFWLNNMLFKYDETTNEPTNICLIDFQFSNATTLLWDLIYFIFTSTTRKDRTSYLSTWLNHYHRTFLDILKHTNNTPPPVHFTFAEFQSMFFSSLSCGLIYMCFAYPFQYSDGKVLEEGFANVTEENMASSEIDRVKLCLRSGNVKEKLLECFHDMEDYGVM